jgi:hypothetical protein
MTVGADAYWFGHYRSRSSYTWSQVAYDNFTQDFDSASAVSWQNRIVPAGHAVVFSVVVTWGQDSRPPVSDMSATTIPDVVSVNDLLLFDGDVSDPGSDELSVYGVVDRDYTNLIYITKEPRIYVGISASDLGIDSRSHILEFYAIDVTGTFSSPSSFGFISFTPTVSPPKMSASLAEAKNQFYLSGNDGEIPLSAATPFDCMWSSIGGIVSKDKCYVTNVGSTAIVAVEFDTLIGSWYNPVASGNLAVTDYVRLSSLPGLTGFEARWADRAATFICPDHSMVITAGVYWFGSDSSTNEVQIGKTVIWSSNAKVTICWRNLRGTPGNKIVASFVVRWGSGSNPPLLDTFEDIPVTVTGSSLSLSGTASNIDGDLSRFGKLFMISSLPREFWCESSGSLGN